MQHTHFEMNVLNIFAKALIKRTARIRVLSGRSRLRAGIAGVGNRFDFHWTDGHAADRFEPDGSFALSLLDNPG
jgi:hypothetical protein